MQSGLIRSNQEQPEAIRSSQKQLEAIRSNQADEGRSPFGPLGTRGVGDAEVDGGLERKERTPEELAEHLMEGRGRSVGGSWKVRGRPWKVRGRAWNVSGRLVEGQGEGVEGQG